MTTPFFFVKKKDEKLRPCQDYRYLNEWTIKNACPLPLISELMDKIKDGKYLNWIFDGVTTMFELKKEMNGRPHLKPIKDYTNLL